MGDVIDILELDRDGGDKKGPRKKKLVEPAFKKPEGMNREVYALLCADNKDKSPLIQTDYAITSKFGFPAYGYKKVKANLGLRQVRKWSWMAFDNPARKDRFQLYHWRREVDKNKEYPFVKMNVSPDIPSYSDAEYQGFLQSDTWNRAETDYLFSLCRKFNNRFVVLEDRWDTSRFSKRSIEDIKDRYYSVCGILAKIQMGNGPDITKNSICVFDAEHERKRKEQLVKLYNRTADDVEEEQYLMAEQRKIEQRRKERDKKTQDVRNLLTAAENTVELRRNEQQLRSAAPLASRLARKKANPQLKGTRSSDLGALSLNNSNIESAGIKFPESKSNGVWLLSSRMKLPSSVGQKRMKAIDQLLKELEVEEHPMPHPDICQNFNELRSDMVLLYELKTALANIEFEQQSLKHQLEASSMPFFEKPQQQTPASAPVTSFSNQFQTPPPPPPLFGSPAMKAPNVKSESVSSVKKISEVIEVASPRKRKAALDQVNFMKKLKIK